MSEPGQSLLNDLRRIVGLLRTLPAVERGHFARRLIESDGARQRRLDRCLAAGPERLVFVCHGNIMRSAFAVGLLQADAPQFATAIVGAGTHAGRGNPAEPTALRMAAELGVDLAVHSSTPYRERGLGARDLVICMDRMNEAAALAMSDGFGDSIFLVGDIARGPREVLDPYQKGDAVTRATFERLTTLARTWLERFRATKRP